jgi:rubredoxin
MMMLVQAYEKPSRWWKREFRVTISLWPRWLAQWLCNHRYTTYTWGFGHNTSGVGTHTTMLRCSDCYKISIVPTTCEHPFNKWEVLTWEEISNGAGGTKKVPLEWYCTDCGYIFTKEMQCPQCHVNMEITEWMEEFSGRFRCSTCGVYYFREELDGCTYKEGLNVEN